MSNLSTEDYTEREWEEEWYGHFTGTLVPMVYETKEEAELEALKLQVKSIEMYGIDIDIQVKPYIRKFKETTLKAGYWWVVAFPREGKEAAPGIGRTKSEQVCRDYLATKISKKYNPHAYVELRYFDEVTSDQIYIIENGHPGNIKRLPGG